MTPRGISRSRVGPIKASPQLRVVKFPRLGGQSDYAAISATRAFNSNLIGLT